MPLSDPSLQDWCRDLVNPGLTWHFSEGAEGTLELR